MIRKFKSKDLKKILEIEEKAFPKSPYDHRIFTHFAEIFPDTFLVFVKEDSEEIIGYIIFSSTGHIASIAVDPMYRQKRIGSKLVKEALRVSNGYAQVEVRETNTVAQRFYHKLGFFQSGRINHYYEEEDAIVMVYHQHFE
jgi:ribosomal-protein-alanine N-acetyltransferase